MTDPQTNRFTPSRARAAVKALRWAFKYGHDPAPPPPRRRPFKTVVGVIVGALLLGGLTGTGLRHFGLLDDNLDRISETVGRVIGERDGSRTWVVAVAPAGAPLTDDLADEIDTIDFDALLAPSAGPETDSQENDEAYSYHEPILQEEPIPGRSDDEIEAMIRDAGLAKVVAPEPALPEAPLWERNAVQVAGIGKRPMIALVIDDLGLNRINTRRAMDLPGPLTLSFLTYGEVLESLTAMARSAGHELLLHVPMQPKDHNLDPGPNVLATDLEPEELKRRLNWGLGRFEGYVGINNHMGSRFTGSLLGMSLVMAELKARGLIFLDSMTSGSSVGLGLARRMDVAHAGRDVFIDNEPNNPKYIRAQLAKLETLAKRHGRAVGIGHPHKKTLDVLAKWLPELERRGFVLVPISAIVRKRLEIAERNGVSG